MGKGIAELIAGIGFISVGTVALYYTTMASMGLIFDGAGNIIQNLKK